MKWLWEKAKRHRFINADSYVGTDSADAIATVCSRIAAIIQCVILTVWGFAKSIY